MIENDQDQKEKYNLKDMIYLSISWGLIIGLLVFTWIKNKEIFNIIFIIVVISFLISIPIMYVLNYYYLIHENKESFDYNYPVLENN